jgi:N-acetylglucosamine-6-phosphate deacetylase
MYGSLDLFKIITLAPEIEGALSTIKELSCSGKIVSMGEYVDEMQ